MSVVDINEEKIKPVIYVNGDVKNRKVFLTSGFQAPFQEGDLLKQVDVASHFQAWSTGGSILHLFTAEELTPEQQEKLIFGIIENFPVQYLTKTPFLSVCNKCKSKFVGKVNKCKNCNSDDMTIWSRPIGYFRPVMRGKIDEDYKNADYVFWLSSRIEDFATRKEVRANDISYLEERYNEIMNY